MIQGGHRVGVDSVPSMNPWSKEEPKDQPEEKQMRKFIVAVVAVVMVVLTAPNAHAANRSNVTEREFDRIENAMPAKKVHRIFDTRGRRVRYYAKSWHTVGADTTVGPSQLRRYRTRRCASPVTVEFQRVNGRWGVIRVDGYYGNCR